MTSSKPKYFSASFLGATITFESHLGPELCPIQSLQFDFTSLPNIGSDQTQRHLSKIVLKPLSEAPGTKWHFPLKVRWRGKTISWVSQNGTSWSRLITCADGSQVYIMGRTLFIYTSSAPTAHQLAFQYGLALLGEDLERHGYVRLHALTYIAPNGTSYLVLADAGLGKSTLAEYLQQTNLGQVLCDELTFWKDDQLYPCPLPIAVAQNSQLSSRNWQLNKGLLPIANPNTGPIAFDHVMVLEADAQATHDSPQRKKLSALRRLKIVMGLGLPQMLEIFLRKNNLNALIRTLFFRAKACRRLNKKVVKVWQLNCKDALRATRVAQWLTRAL